MSPTYLTVTIEDIEDMMRRMEDRRRSMAPMYYDRRMAILQRWWDHAVHTGIVSLRLP